ncbi:MAG: type I-C CRISPR-associated protein Cas5 [Epulopiscium sp. Nele67-Bin001]|nr:MAG: type I-C CRISPR-associated protein Cas5 [Epulopiscium sp. Nuni2H_MBin001]OON91535.1 MAG: type I-C CRISPR-associated protein Cas5 [Epulopiscium sp. Nele67-Bin001]
MSFKIEVWGDKALFTRPELKVERYSYDVITPSAARGIFEAIYWHPGLSWSIDKIEVLNEIKFGTIRRNEVNSKMSARNAQAAMKNNEIFYLNTQDDISQRATTYLKDVRYIIEATFSMTKDASPTDNEGKFAAIIERRLTKGQCYHQPYFGCREFPVAFKLAQPLEPSSGYYYEEPEKDLGIMLYDMDYTNRENITPMFFRVVMRNGIIDVRKSEVLR